MSHSYALHEQVKAMLATKYFMASPEVQELESGTILVSFDMQIGTNICDQMLKVILQFRCLNSGIVSRTILKTKVPSRAYQQVVNIITQINSTQSFSCLEFDYRDGEIGARNFLQCMDYVPSIETIYTMICDANSVFMEHGDRLIEAMGINSTAEESVPKVEIPVSPANKNSKSRGGCYIATCVYGSYDCPQVWTLRRYRDNVLSESALGRAFIKAYYTISPYLVCNLGHYKSIRTVWKRCLDSIVQLLNSKGYSDAPYND